MIIYYINSKSTAIGPSQIIDCHQKMNLCLGDLCVRINGFYAEFIVLDKQLNSSLKWEDYLLVERTIVDLHRLPIANCTLFSFCNTAGRSGKIEVLTLLTSVFHSEQVKNVLDNAINILTYKEDRWNCFYFNSLLLNLQTRDLEVDNSERVLPLFYDYLPIDTKQYFDKIYVDKTKSLRDVFMAVRNKYNKEFVEAMQNYHKTYPNKTIYFQGNKASNIDNIFDNVYDLLIKRGLKQAGNNIWVDEKNNKYFIDLHKM